MTLPPAGQPGITISSPVSGATVAGTKTIITGGLDVTTAVTTVMIKVVNQTNPAGILYTAQVNGAYYAAKTPLAWGGNDITATVTYQNGVKKETSASVWALMQPESVMLTAAPEMGVPTLKPNGLKTFDVSLVTAKTITVPVKGYGWDVNGDGTSDITCTTLSQLKAAYQEPGLYLSTVTVEDAQGNKYTDTVIVNVADHMTMNDFFTVKWNAMKNALLAGDIAGAVNHYVTGSKDVFNERFATMGDDIKKIVEAMGAFRLVQMLDSATAQCELQIMKDGENYSFQVLFIRDFDGAWGIFSY